MCGAASVAGAPVPRQNGTVRDLGIAFGDRGRAVAINNRGQVVGFTMRANRTPPRNSATHAFVWERGTMTDLGTLGGRSSEATAINDRGQIIGWSHARDGSPHAVLWTLKRD